MSELHSLGRYDREDYLVSKASDDSEGLTVFDAAASQTVPEWMAEDLGHRPDVELMKRYASESNQSITEDLPSAKLQIKQAWRRIEELRGEGDLSAEYLAEVLPVLYLEHTYFVSFKDVKQGISEALRGQLDAIIKESESKITRLRDRLNQVTATESLDYLTSEESDSAGVVGDADMSSDQEDFFKALGNHNRILGELHEAQCQYEDLEWRYGEIFFNQACATITSRWSRLKKTKGVNQVEAVRKRLDGRCRHLGEEFSRAAAALATAATTRP